jgi:hypothetical protein
VLLKAREPEFVTATGRPASAPGSWSARIIFGDRYSRVCASIVYRPLHGAR